MHDMHACSSRACSTPDPLCTKFPSPLSHPLMRRRRSYIPCSQRMHACTSRTQAATFCCRSAHIRRHDPAQRRHARTGHAPMHDSATAGVSQPTHSFPRSTPAHLHCAAHAACTAQQAQSFHCRPAGARRARNSSGSAPAVPAPRSARMPRMHARAPPPVPRSGQQVVNVVDVGVPARQAGVDRAAVPCTVAATS